MKKTLLSAVAFSALAGSAIAADLPSRKGPLILPPPPPMWTGFYVGLSAGGTWANSNTIRTLAAPLTIPNPNIFPLALPFIANGLAASANSSFFGCSNGGFIGGGQVGYNFQFSNSFVAGVEADIQGIASSSGAQTSALAVPFLVAEVYTGISSARRSIGYIGTVRGRIGWLATPTLLAYGMAGLAYGGVNLNTTFVGNETVVFQGNPVFGGVAFSDTRTGWTAGGGVEWMFMPNWSAKVEYLYYDLGAATVNRIIAHNVPNAFDPIGLIRNLGIVAGAATQTTTRFNGNIVRAGLNYHFNWGVPAPVVAKY
jgi:outer membrane immunogenic protein